MFDIGGWEFLIVILIAIVVIGPKDLPGTIRTVSSWIRRARELAREFQSGLDDLARETDVEGVKKEIQSDLGLDEPVNAIGEQIKNTVDPDGEITQAFDDEYDMIRKDGPINENSFEEFEGEEYIEHQDVVINEFKENVVESKSFEPPSHEANNDKTNNSVKSNKS